jgi:hypothetical protein
MDTTPVLKRLASHALTLGMFDRVNAHEPTHTPGTGISAAFWAGNIRPLPSMGGLSESAAVVVYNGRLYMAAGSTPDQADVIDPAMMTAVDKLLTAYHGDFELGGTATAIDLLGKSGASLSAEAGYIRYDDGGSVMRTFTITIPVIFAHAWTQAP